GDKSKCSSRSSFNRFLTVFLPGAIVQRSAEKTKSHRQDKVTLLFSQSDLVLSVASQLSLRNSGIAYRTVYVV
ncbi:MAG: hypothetical protein IJA67_15935, partial [Oscillospiraceae bacterium]|nr:hypothetical protein [Oscillospiraceae bacterium]